MWWAVSPRGEAGLEGYLPPETKAGDVRRSSRLVYCRQPQLQGSWDAEEMLSDRMDLAVAAPIYAEVQMAF